MNVELLQPSDARWAAFLERARHDFHHVPGFVELSARTTEPGVPLAALVTDGADAMLLPFVRRDVPGAASEYDATSPYGYPAPLFSGASTPDFVSRATRALGEALREQRYLSLFVRMHPLLDPDTSGFTAGLLVTHGETVVIDLRAPEEEQWRQHQSGHRSEINQALKAGRQQPRIDAEWRHFDDFVRLYTQTMQRLEASQYYLFDANYFRGLRAALGDQRIHLGVVEIDGRIAAAGLFTTVAGIVQYHLSGTDEVFARERPTKLLLHHVRKWATARGLEWFHLGGGLGAAQDSLFRFKAGFSKLRRTFRTWRLAVDPERYAELTRAAGGDPDALGGFFPGYRGR